MAAAPLINPTVASQGEMWIMLMQMIPSADAIGQTKCDASRAMGARTFVTPAAFAQAATLGRASGSGSEGWKTRLGRLKPRVIVAPGIPAGPSLFLVPRRGLLGVLRVRRGRFRRIVRRR